MKIARKRLAVTLISMGLLGIVVFLTGNHYQLPIIPAADFAKGLWFGVCVGMACHGVFLLIVSKKQRVC